VIFGVWTYLGGPLLHSLQSPLSVAGVLFCSSQGILAPPVALARVFDPRRLWRLIKPPILTNVNASTLVAGPSLHSSVKFLLISWRLVLVLWSSSAMASASWLRAGLRAGSLIGTDICRMQMSRRAAGLLLGRASEWRSRHATAPGIRLFLGSSRDPVAGSGTLRRSHRPVWVREGRRGGPRVIRQALGNLLIYAVLCLGCQYVFRRSSSLTQQRLMTSS
jgi:hypothetical protein